MIRKLNQQENKNKENQHGYNKIFLEKNAYLMKSS